MPGLAASRWAAKDSRSSSVPVPSSRTFSSSFDEVDDSARDSTSELTAVHANHGRAQLESAIAELARYSKIVRRMKWKLPFLDVAYRRATAPDDDSTDRPEAELMFKLDFFEYYMLCERALVHLQGVFGIAISRDFAPGENRGPSGHAATHRYHANVLGSLDHEGNPLHEVLGKGRVRRQLARAKDLRNRWKNADTGTPVADNNHVLPLEAYDLAGILATIHEGLDNAYAIASGFVSAGSSRNASTSASTGDMHDGLALMDMDPDTTEEEQWGFMMDAMDWEAV